MKKAISLFLILFLVSCTSQPVIIPDISRGKFLTEDNVSIAYTYNNISSDKAVILLHMLGRNRHDWNTFAANLNQNNFSTLALDFRGHGGSEGKLDEFTEKEFNDMALDVKAAEDFINNENYSEVYIVGASVGANIALIYSSQENTIKRIVLLSPSKNYKGIETADIINNYKGELMIVAGSKDKKSYTDSLEINNSFNGEKEFLIFNSDSHGTNILLNHNEVNKKIINFLKK